MFYIRGSVPIASAVSGGQPLTLQHCPLVAKETLSWMDAVMWQEEQFSPESEGFWEWRADGTLTITRWSSTGDVSKGLKVVEHVQEHMWLKYTFLFL